MVDSILSSLGGGSGIDTKALVESLVAAERAPKEFILDSKTTTLKTQISGYGALRSAMSGIQDSMKLLADADTFNARNVAFADTTLVTPTSVDPGAAVGDYSINVTTLASAHSLSVSGFSDKDAVVGNGTLSFSFGDWDAGHTTLDTSNSDKASKTLTIDESNNTLSGIRDAINNGDFGVQASVIDTGGGNYALQIASESGASNEMKISVTEGVSPGLAALQFDETTQAMAEKNKGVDAAFKLNGLDITRATNNIDDVINGLKFTLNGVSADANDNMTVSVEADKSFGEQIVRDFVEVYNLFLEQTGNLTTPADVDEDAEDQTLGSLSRDPTTKTMLNQIRSQISSTLTGLDGNYTALATIGIQTQISGELEIKEDLFKVALDNNYNALTDIFAGTTSTSDARLGIVKTSAATQPGTYDVVVTTDPAKGYMTGGGITVDDAAVLGLDLTADDFSLAAGGKLDTSAGDYSFQIKVDGTTSNLITLTGNYATPAELAADLQAQINGDSNLSGVAAAVDISYDSGTNSFTTTSRTYGGASAISFLNVSAEMGQLSLGGGATAGSLTGGAIIDAGTTALGSQGGLTTTNVVDNTVASVTEHADTSASVNGTAITGLNGTAHTAGTFTLPLSTSIAETLDITVDGSTASIDLTGGSYNTAADLAAALQTQINAGLLPAGPLVTVGYDAGNDRFTFTSDSSGSASNVQITNATGLMADLGIAGGALQTGIDDAFVAPLDTAGYSFDIAVDGAASVNVTLGASAYSSAGEVASALQSAINLAAATPVTVAYDAAADRYSITSDATGSASNIEIATVAGGMGNLGFSVEAGVAGDDDTFTNPLVVTTGQYTFNYDVDGVAAGAVDLIGTFNTTEDVRAELELQMAGVSVGYDSATQSYSFTSQTTGVASDVDINTASANMANLGITDASGTTGHDATVATSGVDVVGTIDGVAAFGSGNILLPELGSTLSGLSLEVAPGVTTATITIARGFGNEVNNILDTFLEKNGLIATRETRMNTQLTDIATDRTTLDRQMEARHAMLQNQFLAMESIIRSLNAASSSLDGLVDRLPFTAPR
ncbi:MAG: flagellar filament capping protein FliD [Motiliproteus sp.]